MKRHAIVLAVVVAIAAAIGVYRARDRATHDDGRTTAGSASPPPGGASGTGERRVRKLSPDDRRRLAEAIATARDRRRAAARAAGGGGGAGTTAAPSLPDDTITLEQVSGTLKTALADAIPLLADCYGDTGSSGRRTAAVTMVMTSEPEVGTVIDTSELRDEHDQPLPRELDDCLRTTIESLGLPPLEQGGRLPLKYSFVFD